MLALLKRLPLLGKGRHALVVLQLGRLQLRLPGFGSSGIDFQGGQRFLPLVQLALESIELLQA